MEASKIKIGGTEYRIKDSNVGDLSGLPTTSKTIAGALQEIASNSLGLNSNTVLCKVNGREIKYGGSVSITGDATDQIESDEDGIYFTDGSGYVFMKYTSADGFDASKVSSSLINKLSTPSYPFLNKKLYLFGNTNNNWAKKLATAYNMTVTDCSSSTDTLATKVSSATAPNENGVYIIITMKSTDIASIKAGIEAIANKYYSAKILLVLPFRKNNNTITDYDALVADARRFSVVVYNSIDGSCVRAWDSNFKSAYMTSDGDDFTDAGSSFFVPTIANYLKKL